MRISWFVIWAMLAASDVMCMAGADHKRSLSMDDIDNIRVEHKVKKQVLYVNNKTSSLMVAVRDKELDNVKRLVVSGKDVNEYTEFGETLLHMAARNDSIDILKFLVRAGANVDALNSYGFTPLETAVQYRSTGSVNLLLKWGVWLHNVSDVIDTVDNPSEIFARVKEVENLFAAIRNQDLNVLDRLLEINIPINNRIYEGYTALSLAAVNGCLDICKRLVTHGAYIDLGTYEGLTPLILACMNDHNDIVKYLVFHGADPNASSYKGSTALHIAVKKANVELVKFLICNNADVRAIDNKGNTANDIAKHRYSNKKSKHRAEYNKIMQLFNGVRFNSVIKNHSKKNFFRSKLETNVKQLFDAITQKKLDQVQRLINQKYVDVNVVTQNGNTPLLKAVTEGYSNILIWLLEQGADPNVRRTKDGASTVCIAAKRHHTEILKYLLYYDVDINIPLYQDNVDLELAEGSNVLHVLHRYEYATALMRYLLDNGAKVNHVDKKGRTPLQLAEMNGFKFKSYLLRIQEELLEASKQGDLKKIKELVKFGGIINVVDRNDHNPLMYAIENGHLDVIEYFVEQGAKIDIANKYIIDKTNNQQIKQFFALQKNFLQAVERNNISKVKILLKAGAKVNTRRYNGWTALMTAARYGNLSMVKRLIGNGANANFCTRYGWNALMFAAESGYGEIVSYLLSKGAILNEVNRENKMAIDLAKDNKHRDIVELLHNYDNVFDAVKQGDFEMVRSMLKRGVTLNACNKDGCSPLMIAIKMDKSSEFINFLIDNGANDNANRKEDNVNASFLLVSHSYMSCWKKLKKVGIDVQRRSFDGKTNLYIACQRQRSLFVPALIGAGVNVNSCSFDGVSPLMITSKFGPLSNAKYLVNAGADIEAVDEEGNTALMYAVKNNQYAIVKYLISKGALIEQINKKGESVVSLSKGKLSIESFIQDFIEYRNLMNSKIIAGEVKAVESLSEKLVNGVPLVKAIDSNGRTCLHLAAQYGSESIIRSLIKAKAQIDVTDKFGKTPLNIAIQYKQSKIQKILLEQRKLFDSIELGNCEEVKDILSNFGEINAILSHGYTTLMCAADHNQRSIVELLVDAKININAKDYKGWTALMYAAKHGYYDIVQYLANKGGRINSFSYDEWTPLTAAVYSGDLNTVKYIAQHGYIRNAAVDDREAAIDTALEYLKKDSCIKKALEYLTDILKIHHTINADIDRVGLYINQALEYLTEASEIDKTMECLKKDSDIDRALKCLKYGADIDSAIEHLKKALNNGNYREIVNFLQTI